MCNDVITLIKETYYTNEAGDPVTTQTEREVFCQVRSVGMREKYQAQAVGLLPELTFILPDYYEYDDEQYVKYNEKTYRVIRTFVKDSHEIELVVTKDGT